MLLVKNNLKKKRTIDDDEYLNYLKFSHLQPTSKNNRFDIETSDKATQYPDIMNNFTQTDKKNMVDKETDTYDELNKIDPPYRLTMTSSNHKSKEPSRAEKMAQVITQKLNPTSKPSSDNSGGGDGGVSRNIKRGFRLAEFALETALTTATTTANVAEFLWNATAPPEYDIHNQPDDEEEEDPPSTTEQSSSSTNNPVHRDRSRSRDSTRGSTERRDESENLGDGLLRRGASRSRSITPSSGKASSAKTTPRKKSK